MVYLLTAVAAAFIFAVVYLFASTLMDADHEIGPSDRPEKR